MKCDAGSVTEVLRSSETLIHKTFKATSVTVLKILLLELVEIEDLSSSRLKIVEIRTVKLLHKHS